MKSNWFANKGSFPIFALLTIGGFVGGTFLGSFMFYDKELWGLKLAHDREKDLFLEGQITPYRT